MKRWSIVFLALALVFSTASTYPKKAAVQSGNITHWHTSTVLAAAQGDVLQIGMGSIYSSDRSGAIDTIRANPNIKIIGLLGVLMVAKWDAADSASNYPFDWDLWVAVRPYIAHSSTGDTAMIFRDNLFLNFIDHQAVNRTLISRIVRVLYKYQKLYPGRCDGVFHDYCYDAGDITVPTNVTMTGIFDFDHDGVAFASDTLEQALLKAWQLEYFDSIRIVLGNDFIQTMNGRAPQIDADFAIRANGINYEKFPAQYWYTAKSGWAGFVSNQASGWLRPSHCKTWSCFVNQDAEPPTTCAIMALIGDAYYVQTYLHNGLFNDWMLHINAGMPTGPAITTTYTDSTVVTRAFVRGTARLSFYNSSGAIKVCRFDSL